MSLTDERIIELWDSHIQNWRLTGKTLINPVVFARLVEAEATKSAECPRCFSPIKGQAGVEPAKNGTTANPQEPVAWVEVVDRHEGPYNFHGKELLDSGKHNLYTTPKPCQSCAEKQSAIDVWEGRYADLSAKCAELEDFCISQGNELAKLDEKVFDQDRLLKQQAEKISATLVALAGLPDGALDGGWTYAVMNKYALGLEAKCAELEAECAAMRENSKRWHGLFNTAVASLDRSENNAVIKEIEAERDALAMQNQQMREALQRMLNGIPANANGEWVTDHHGFEGEYLGSEQHNPSDIIYSMAGIAQEALALPDTSEIIKRHDAAVLRKAAEHLEGYEYVFNAPPINYAEAHELRLMANELEKSCQP